MKTLSPHYRKLLLDCCVFFLANRKVPLVAKKIQNVNLSTFLFPQTLLHSHGPGFPVSCDKGPSVSAGCFPDAKVRSFCCVATVGLQAFCFSVLAFRDLGGIRYFRLPGSPWDPVKFISM